MTDVPIAWSVTARNLPEHARNPIHTDDGARAQGFPRALVAGVTTYAYLTHPAIAAWGADWVAHGGGEVRFRRPVFDGDTVHCEPTVDGDAVLIAAVTDEPEQPRATFRAVRHGGAAPEPPTGEVLPTRHLRLEGEWGADYALRAGDDLTLCTDLGIVHPSAWPALANNLVHAVLARGSWIHTRSIVRHHRSAPAGATAAVHGTVVRRFWSHGERAVVDVRIVVDDALVASLEHEAIVDLAAPRPS